MFRASIEYVHRKDYHFVHCANYSFASRAYIDLGKRQRFVDPNWRRRVAIGSSFSSYTRCTDNRRKNNVRTGRAGVSKITNVALTPVVSGSRERPKLYGASRRMARARHGRDGPIVARSSPAYQSLYTHERPTSLYPYATYLHENQVVPIEIAILDNQKRYVQCDDYNDVRNKGFPFG